MCIGIRSPPADERHARSDQSRGLVLHRRAEPVRAGSPGRWRVCVVGCLVRAELECPTWSSSNESPHAHQIRTGWRLCGASRTPRSVSPCATRRFELAPRLGDRGGASGRSECEPRRDSARLGAPAARRAQAPIGRRRSSAVWSFELSLSGEIRSADRRAMSAPTGAMGRARRRERCGRPFAQSGCARSARRARGRPCAAASRQAAGARASGTVVAGTSPERKQTR